MKLAPTVTSPVTSMRQSRRFLYRSGRLMGRREIGPIIVLLALAGLFQALSGDFFTPLNLEGISTLGSSIAIVSIGVTMLIMSGEFDLSVGATYAFAPIMMVIFLTHAHLPAWLAFILALVLTAGLGIINGIITTVFRIPSLITTLAASFGLGGVNLYITSGNNLLYYHSNLMVSLLGGTIPGTTLVAPLGWAFALTLVFWYIADWTQYGNWSAAAGGRSAAAREMGVPTNKVKITNFALCAMLAGLAGCTAFASYGVVSASYGQDYQLLAIVATVVGGTSIYGVSGSIPGALVGAFTIGSLNSGLILAGAPGSWYQSIVGLILVIAVIGNVRVARLSEQLLRLASTNSR